MNKHLDERMRVALSGTYGVVREGQDEAGKRSRSVASMPGRSFSLAVVSASRMRLTRTNSLP